MTRRCRLAGLSLLAGATVVVLVVGGQALGPGHPTDLEAWRTWLVDADPVSIAMAVLRVTAVLGATWVALTATTHLVLAEVAGGRRWLERLSPGIVRAAAGATVSLAVLATPVSAGADDDPRHEATMRPITLVAPTTTSIAPPPASTTTAPSVTTTTSAPPTTSTVAPPTTVVPPASSPSPAARPVAVRLDTYVVERSESLWSIAADELGERLGRSPTDAEVTPFWLRLVHANADRLVVPGNADLIYAGQELVLPS